MALRNIASATLSGLGLKSQAGVFQAASWAASRAFASGKARARLFIALCRL